MKKISFLFVSVIIFTGLVIFQTKAIASDEVAGETNVTDETVATDEAVATDGTTTTADTTPTTRARTFQRDSKLFMSSVSKIKLADTDNIEVGSVFYRINDGADQEYSEPFSIEEEGTHTLVYYSVDRLGNKEVAQILTIVVDNTPPDVALNVLAPFIMNEEMIFASEFFNYQYSITARDNLSGVASVRYSVSSIEDAPQQQYLRPFFISSTTPPKVNIFSEDRVGNSTTQYITNIYDENGTLIKSGEDLVITIDNTAPVVTITPDKEFFMKDDMQVASREYKFTITATDEEAGVRAIYYRLGDDEDFILYTGQEFTFSNNGPQRIESIAVDKVGNTSAGTILEFYIDIIPSITDLKFSVE